MRLILTSPGPLTPWIPEPYSDGMKDKNRNVEGYIKSQTAVVFVCLALAVGFVSGIALTIYKLDAQAPFTHEHDQPNQQGGKDDMLAALQDEVKRNPDNTGAWVQLGHLYFDSDQHKKAIQAYEKSLELDPKNTNVITDLGIMYRRSGLPQKAIESFERAVVVDPKHETARFNKGIVLMHDLDDKDGAITAWEELLAINPLAMAADNQSVDQLIKHYKEGHENNASIDGHDADGCVHGGTAQEPAGAGDAGALQDRVTPW